MSASIRTVLAVDPDLTHREVESLVDDPGIQIVEYLEDDGDWQSAAGADADVLLVAGRGVWDTSATLVARAVREHPDRPVVVVTTSSPNGLMRKVFESGADDVVNVAGSAAPAADTYFALQKAVARRSGAAAAAAATGVSGSLICVLGPKGGTGKTLTSVNLASALTAAGHRTLVVDLDLQFGDIGLVLGLQPERTIHDLAVAGGSLDPSKVGSYIAEHPSGLHALLAPIRPDQATVVTPAFLGELYPVLRAAYDFVVVDTPPGFTPEVIASIDASSAVCMVAMLDAPSLKNARLGLETLDLMGYSPERVRVLLNRADANLGVDRRDVAGILGRTPDVEVPSQREIVRAINAGVPLVISAHRSEPAKAFRALAERYVADRTPAEPSSKGRRRLLRRT